MVYIERLYGDWNDDDIVKSWVDQSTIDCCKLESQNINNIHIDTKYITNKYNPKKELINNDYKLNGIKKLNTKINIIKVNNNGEYSRRNENFSEKFKIKHKRNNKNR
jgi:hypothetical protein